MFVCSIAFRFLRRKKSRSRNTAARNRASNSFRHSANPNPEAHRNIDVDTSRCAWNNCAFPKLTPCSNVPRRRITSSSKTTQKSKKVEENSSKRSKSGRRTTVAVGGPIRERRQRRGHSYRAIEKFKSASTRSNSTSSTTTNTRSLASKTSKRPRMKSVAPPNTFE